MIAACCGNFLDFILRHEVEQALCAAHDDVVFLQMGLPLDAVVRLSGPILQQVP